MLFAMTQNRRTFLATLGGSFAGLAVGPRTLSAIENAAERHAKLERIGIQLYTLRRPAAADAPGAGADQLRAVPGTVARVLERDAPVADADKTVTVAEDSGNSALGIAAPTDVDGDPLTITVTGIPNAGIGTVYLADGATSIDRKSVV